MTGLTNRVYIKCNGNGRLYMKVTVNDPQLATPQNVSASGTTVSWSAVTNATSYKIFAGSTNIATTTSISYNLTNSAGWTSLSDGNYNITIVAKADGYLDSEHSSSVVVTKSTTPAPADDELAGTWTFNETLDLSAEGLSEQVVNEGGWETLSFVTEDAKYTGLTFGGFDGESNAFTSLSYEGIEVYNGVWNSELDRTITIDTLLEEVETGEALLMFLQNNAVKQGI